jgi:membrane fusion protein (multidrug efflux system)
MAAHLARCTSLVALILIAACSKQETPAPPPPEVEVIEARPGPLTVVQSFVGRISAIRSAEVRARVAGILQKRVYTEGTDVKEGDLLFIIDPAPYRAALRERQAALAQARASESNAKARAGRFTDLSSSGVVARQDVEDAVAQANTTRAAVAEAVAALERARLDLSYTTVRSPIAGRASKALVTEGALVGQSEPTHLTTVEQIDQVYVDFNQSVSDLEALRRQQASGTIELAAPRTQKVRVVYEDGTAYPHEGTLSFADLAVEPTTGAVSLRAVLPNPERSLLPGMFVRVSLEQGARQNVYVIPQAAVQRDQKGLYVLVVGADGNAAQKSVQAQSMEQGNWVITGGLQPGDRVIVSGLQRVQPGKPVRPMAAGSEAGSVREASANAQAAGSAK